MTNEEQQKHEAAIDAWRKEAKRVPDRSRVGNCYIIADEEIDAICDLARRAPRPETKQQPRPWSCDTCEDSGTVEKCESPGEHANRSQEPCPDCKPEPRPSSASSALLEAAKAARHGPKTWVRGDSRVPGYVLIREEIFAQHEVEMDSLREAIKAEEARGPSESTGPTVSDYLTVAEELRVPSRVGALLESARLLLCKERDEAIARAEKAESERDEAMAELIDARAEDWNTVEPGDNPPSDVASVDDPDWHQTMTKWLKRRDAGHPCSPGALEAVIALIVRRELARGAK
jgi:hypothetical protein